MLEFNIVRSNVTIESQPTSLVRVTVAVLLDEVYSFHQSMYKNHNVFVIYTVLEFNIVRSNVTTESHPSSLVKLNVGYY